MPRVTILRNRSKRIGPGFAGSVVATRVVALPLIFALVLFVGAGTSQAGMDNQMSLVDGHGRTMTVQQWDTVLNGCSRWTATG
jgi:hypothetical protein